MPGPYRRIPTGCLVTVFVMMCWAAFAEDTVRGVDRGADALSAPLDGMPEPERAAFERGRVLYSQVWVSPIAGKGSGFVGLGPVFNETSCIGCHIGNGRGSVPDGPDQAMHGMLVRLSVPGRNDKGGPVPVPGYGDQLNDHAIGGVPSEGQARLSYTEKQVSLADGTRVTLRRPSVRFTSLAFGPTNRHLMTSVRIAQPVAGAGLLDVIPAADILANARKQKASDGPVHGHPNFVWNPATSQPMLGRFGWKANQPSLAIQSAGAANGDMGLTSPYFPDKNCPASQTDCAQSLTGPQPDLSPARLAELVAYVQGLAAPRRRAETDASVQKGEALFAAVGCEQCHKSEWKTAADARPTYLASQTIHPYTDLLLHDMGPGLADGRPDYLAGGREWRSAPLWGLGLALALNPKAGFLHDGRARTVTEAILWHDGEARMAQRRFTLLPKPEREALLSFLNSL